MTARASAAPGPRARATRGARAGAKSDRGERLCRAARRLRRDLSGLRFGAPVTHVYDPVEYASRPYFQYLRRFGAGPKRVVFLGMNPGPYGMVQTGVPFGEVGRVRDWLGIRGAVGQPRRPHPRRPVLGFDCPRTEVSGARLWSTVADCFGTPEAFFEHHFIANYCPLVFMEESGRNRTPDKLAAGEREPLFEACDRHLQKVIEVLEPEWLVGIGGFASERARRVASPNGPEIGQILHPSPANPRANRDWAGEVRRQLRALGLCRGGS
ncbi:MAG: uracil-DNA glycosylase family protein [Myxococcota bacterium]